MTVLSLRNKFVDYVKTIKAIADENPKSLVDRFIITYFSLIASLDFDQLNKQSFTKLDDKKASLKPTLELALPLLYDELLDLKESSKGVIPAEKPHIEVTVEDFFIGLTKEANNDADYKDAPSALSLATFRVHKSLLQD